jgi:hypothetical protein
MCSIMQTLFHWVKSQNWYSKLMSFFLLAAIVSSVIFHMAKSSIEEIPQWNSYTNVNKNS